MYFTLQIVCIYFKNVLIPLVTQILFCTIKKLTTFTSLELLTDNKKVILSPLRDILHTCILYNYYFYTEIDECASNIHNIYMLGTMNIAQPL